MTAPKTALPTEAPVMLLPNALLFPHALMPLHIFEERYRTMLRWALKNDRIFCIALLRPGVAEAVTEEDFFQTAGVGLIRACVTRDDGTSHLMLQGLARVRFTGFTQLVPFRIARIAPVPSLAAKQSVTDPLSEELRKLCTELRDHGFELPGRVEEFLARMDDAEMLVDSIAHSFIRDPIARQCIFEEQDVADRMRETIRCMKKELSK